MTSLSTQEWHQRFRQQASWTSQLRDYLLREAGLPNTSRLLEVGCGTGAVLLDVDPLYMHLFGLDISLPNLLLAKENCPNCSLVQADAHSLPYGDHQYDLVYCHYLLLWVKSAYQALLEMVRVTRPGGIVMAMAEPDYGGRIDFPEEFERLGKLQIIALQNQGADTSAGRKLASLFHKVGLDDIEIGVIGAEWKIPIPKQEWLEEWKIFEDDLQNFLSPQELASCQQLYDQTANTGERILFIPTFYAWGRKRR